MFGISKNIIYLCQLNSVDAVGNQRYVFNIKGNDYRLIVLILFTPKTIYIRFVGTHKEYDAIKDIQNI
jgi:Uncharacterized protein conserved in bacteria